MTLAEVLGVDTVTKTGEDSVSVADLEKDYSSDENAVIGIYFSAHWCGPCRGFTPKLVEAYEKLKADGKKFEIIFASSDRDEDAFKDYFKDMPWLALPFADRDAKATLSKKYKVAGIPTLVLLDGQGNLKTKDGRSKVAKLSDFPWIPPTFDKVIGNEFVRNDKTTCTFDDAFADKFYGIYFSAHWCPPCKAFTPKLAAIYKKVKEKNPDFEIIFASSDQSQDAFDEYFGEMPWTAVPYEDRDRKEKLSDFFEVRGIPTFVMMKGNTVLNKNARGAVMGDPEGADFPWAPKLVNDVDKDTEGINSTPSVVVLMESLEVEKKTQLEKGLLELAEQSKKDGKDVIFFTGMTAGDDSLTNRIRTMTKIGDAQPKAQALILDIGDEGAYYTLDKEVSKETLSEFLNSFNEKTLERKQLA